MAFRRNVRSREVEDKQYRKQDTKERKPIARVYFDLVRYVDLYEGDTLHSACEEYTYWPANMRILLRHILPRTLQRMENSDFTPQDIASQSPKDEEEYAVYDEMAERVDPTEIKVTNEKFSAQLERGNLQRKKPEEKKPDREKIPGRKYSLDPRKQWHVVPFGIQASIIARYLQESAVRMGSSNLFMASCFEGFQLSYGQTLPTSSGKEIGRVWVYPYLTFNCETPIEMADSDLAFVSPSVFILKSKTIKDEGRVIFQQDTTIYVRKDENSPIGVFGFIWNDEDVQIANTLPNTTWLFQRIYDPLEGLENIIYRISFPRTFAELYSLMEPAAVTYDEKGKVEDSKGQREEIFGHMTRSKRTSLIKVRNETAELYDMPSGMTGITVLDGLVLAAFETNKGCRLLVVNEHTLPQNESIRCAMKAYINSTSHPGRLELQDDRGSRYLFDYRGKVELLAMGLRVPNVQINYWAFDLLIGVSNMNLDSPIQRLTVSYVTTPTYLQLNPESHPDFTKLTTTIERNEDDFLLRFELNYKDLVVADFSPDNKYFETTVPQKLYVYKFQFNKDQCCVYDRDLKCIRLMEMTAFWESSQKNKVPARFLQQGAFSILPNGQAQMSVIDISTEHKRQNDLVNELFNPSVKGRMDNQRVQSIIEQTIPSTRTILLPSEYHIPFKIAKTSQISKTPLGQDQKSLSSISPSSLSPSSLSPSSLSSLSPSSMSPSSLSSISPSSMSPSSLSPASLSSISPSSMSPSSLSPSSLSPSSLSSLSPSSLSSLSPESLSPESLSSENSFKLEQTIAQSDLFDANIAAILNQYGGHRRKNNLPTLFAKMLL